MGLVVQSTLANFASATFILLFKPYIVGHLIEAQEIMGNVKELQTFITVLLTPENKTSIAINGAMANGKIINDSADGRLRVYLTFGMNHSSSIVQTRTVLNAVMWANPLVSNDTAPSITVVKLDNKGMELPVRSRCDPKDYLDRVPASSKKAYRPCRWRVSKAPSPA